ncbi:MAG: TonB-dependent receptor [Pseudomonadota bacterium]
MSNEIVCKQSRIAQFASASALALLSTFIAAPALAQTAPDVDASAADEDEVSVQDVVIVTVERRAGSLQDYAGTAAAITGEDIKALGLASIEDLDSQIPGLAIANNQGNIEVYIRGVGSSNNTELGDPAAATHLNGVYVPRPSGFGAAFFDIERVEVNIGPQGTLRGRNATAGSVNVIPWAPGIGQTNGMVEASVGNFDEWRLEGVANIPVTENSAFRIAGFMLEHDSYLENVTPDSVELGLTIPTSEDEGIGVAEAADDFGIRAAYKIEPTNDLAVTLTYDYIEQKGTGYTGINFANPLGNGIDPDDVEPREVFGRGITPEEDTEHWGFKGHIEYETDWFNIEYIGSFRDLVYDYEFITPASPNYEGALDNLSPETFDDFSRVRFTTDSESTIHELRFFSDTAQKLYWTAGAFLFDEDQRTFLGTTGDRNPFFNGIEFNQTTTTESFSVYGDATYSVTDRFRLTGGLRYTEDEKERFGINARYAFGVGGPDFSCCFINGVAHGTEGFEFAGLDRTIIVPDTNSDGVVDSEESIAFFFDGIANFGARDGFDDIFPGGQEIQVAIPNAADRPPCEGNFALVGSCANGIVPEFDGVVDFSLAPFNSSFAPQSGRLEDDFVDWRLRAEFDVSDDNLVYGLIATGNKSGGFNDNVPGTEGFATNPAQNAPVEFDTGTLAPTYESEKLTLYEIGSKNEFEVGGMPAILNVSAFYYDYEDLQLTTLTSTAQILDREGVQLTPEQLDGLGGNVVSFTFNAADAEIYGAQLEGGLDLPSDINLKGNLLWLPEANVVNSVEIQDARYQADVDPGNAVNRSIDGNRLIRTPEVQFNGSISKVWQASFGSFDGVLSAGYRSSQFMTIFNGIDYDPTDEQTANGSDARLDDKIDGYWTFDAGFGYSHGTDGRYRLEGYVSNLTDEEQPQAIIITQFDNTRFFNRPRTYGARLRVSF